MIGDSRLDRSDSWHFDHKARFHGQAVFLGLWTLVGLIGVNTMRSLRTILEPLLWAFFLMMALLPLCDGIEWMLTRICASLPATLRCGIGSPRELNAEAHQLERQYSGLVADRSRRLRENGSRHQEESESDWSTTSTVGEAPCGGLRMIAVLFTIVIFLGMSAGFIIMIYQSANHMQSVWPHYEEGAQRLLDRLDTLKERIPTDIADKVTEKVLKGMEEVLSFVLSYMVEHVTSILVELLMTLLYMIFWLCQPVFIGDTVTALFKQYILLKTFASVMYAFCIYVLLAGLGVDLAIVFGLITFLFNFVPEIGTIAAMMLPVPVILFDGRFERPLLNLALALGGQFLLKFIFANIIEVKLVERQNDFRMHPVTILFFVAFFGGIWGATGMLVSVPIMAAVKAAAGVMPPVYRDAILVVLEGDREAPARFALRRSISVAAPQGDSPEGRGR